MGSQLPQELLQTSYSRVIYWRSHVEFVTGLRVDGCRLRAAFAPFHVGTLESQ